jgi:hypothetical protein
MMATVTVWKDSKKRCNPHARYTSAEGTRYTKAPPELYEDTVAADAPADFDYDTYTVQEIDDAPYVVFTRKSDEQLAEVRWNKLKAIRDDLTENGGCLVQGKWFHTDVKSKQQQMALAMAAQHTALSVPWKTMDGTFIEMTSAIAGELFAAQMAREIEIFGICQTKRTDTTDVNTGWPDRYVVA